MVLDPTIRVPEGWGLMTVPATAKAEPPAEIIVPAMDKAAGFGANVCPATANGESLGKAGDGVRSGMVGPPIAHAPNRPRLTMAPATATAGPPAEIVVPALEKAEGFGVKGWPATVNTPVAVGVDDGWPATVNTPVAVGADDGVGGEMVESASNRERGHIWPGYNKGSPLPTYARDREGAGR